MNSINRLVVIVELVIAIALMPIIVVASLLFDRMVPDLVTNTARNLVDGPNWLYTQSVLVGIAVFIFILAILVLFLELHRPSLHGLKVQQVTDGQVEVTADALVRRLEHDILQVDQVTRVKPHVSADRKGAVNVLLEIETTPDVSLPAKTQEVISVARQAVEQQMGLQLGKVQVQVDHARHAKRQASAEQSPKQVAIEN